jgi:hypothetical protein
VGGILAAAPARAPGHVAPSARENNRYILVAPLGDRVRLVYTVYMGEEPGRRARARMDGNRDRVLSDAESQAWADELAAEVAASLTLEVDGRAVPIGWAEVDIGLGEPSAAAGAFAVDMVAWACFDRPREVLQHTIRFTDRFAIDAPGETELRAEESPGVLVTRSALGPAASAPDRPRLEFKWRGGAGPAVSGYLIELKVEPGLAAFSDLPCPSGEPAEEEASRWPWLVFGGAVFLIAGFLLARRLVTGSARA